MGVVSTEALLFGLGLGKATAASAAAAQWILKDGAGYVAKVWYGSVAGKLIDTDPKSYRLMADGLEDVGGALEILTPLFPNYFLPLASLATALKAVAGMTGTATRHSIYRSLGRARHNVGEIASKGESQGVVLKLGGLAMGLTVSSVIGQRYFLLLSTYSACAVVHLAANWQAMKCVQFTSLNRQRSSIVMNAYLDAVLARPGAAPPPPLPLPTATGAAASTTRRRRRGPVGSALSLFGRGGGGGGGGGGSSSSGGGGGAVATDEPPAPAVAVPDPRAVSSMERILLPPWAGWQPSIVLGATVAAACPSRTAFEAAAETFRGERWFAVAGGGAPPAAPSPVAAAAAATAPAAVPAGGPVKTTTTRVAATLAETTSTTTTISSGVAVAGAAGGEAAPPPPRRPVKAHQPRAGVLNVVLHKDATEDDQLRAFFFAQVHARTPAAPGGTEFGGTERMEAALAVARRHFGPWLAAAKAAGWETAYPMLNVRPSRLVW